MHEQLNLLESAPGAEESPSGFSSSFTDGSVPRSSTGSAPAWHLDSNAKEAGRQGLARARAALEAGRQALAAAKDTPATDLVVHPGRPSTLLPEEMQSPLPSPARPDIPLTVGAPGNDDDNGQLDFAAAA